jgi:peptidoglycan hydrolase-like protein with peptidoglycan-binding domain
LLPSRPTDTVCLAVAVAGTGFIVVNALFLQSGPHPAPIFSVAEAAAPAATVAESVPLPPKRQPSTRIPAAILPAAAPPTTNASAPVRTSARDSRHDPIADLLEPANRTVAVQRALTEFGYGQIKPTGTVGPDTKTAIEKFERERKLPVTGKVSERLTQELSAMKGGPL